MVLLALNSAVNMFYNIDDRVYGRKRFNNIKLAGVVPRFEAAELPSFRYALGQPHYFEDIR